MNDHSEAFVAFDTSKLRNAVAIAEAGRSGEIRFIGEIENSATATAKLVRKLAAKYQRLTFCYEAGPTGYGLYRQIGSWSRLHGGCAVADPDQARRSGKDQLARRTEPGQAAACRRADGSLGSRPAARGDA
jgi:hypothetical protein